VNATQVPCLLHRLPCRDDEGRWRVVIEAAAGTRNKYKYDPKLGVLALHKVLPLGTGFPYDFGFVPSTLGEDGDPLDALVFADEPLAPGSIVPCRLLGILKARQTGEKGKIRNDRLLAASIETHRYRGWRKQGDVPAPVLEEIERFFVFYNAQRGIEFEPQGRQGPKAARTALERGIQAFGHARK